MDINKFLIKNSDGKPSVTMTAFVIGFIVVNVKLILSGLKLNNLTLSAFTGSEYALAVGSLGATYILRRKDNKADKKNVK